MCASADQLRLLALCKIKGVSWHFLAREVQRPGGLDRLYATAPHERSVEASTGAALILARRSDLDDLAAEASEEVRRGLDVGARLITVIDDDYPENLRDIFNLPPFLFVRGTLEFSDRMSIAVVGTREASPEGLRRASRMAKLLSERRVTVLSGLARGVDTAAHRAALDAGGRTIAVVGTGICRTFPSENSALSDEIIKHGAVVSQFWPLSPPTSWTFPRRNVTMSGMSQGSLVIEASRTSGAKMQARLALEHGKKVFLIRSLIGQQSWAQQYVRDRGAVPVDDIDDVIAALRGDTARRSQVVGDQLELDLGELPSKATR
jgi:DNA processing protein